MTKLKRPSPKYLLTDGFSSTPSPRGRGTFRMVVRQRRSWVRAALSFTVFFIVFVFPFSICHSAIAEEVFLRDVPEGHWASDAVYELIRMGVAAGFPDGTFRGKKEITRYEMASMLSRFANSFNTRGGKEDKLVEELKSEVALIKFKRKQVAEGTQVSGMFESRGRLKPVSPCQGRLDYRLRLAMKKDFGYGSSLQMRLDTVDAGFNTTNTREFAARLIDIESRFKLGGIDYKVNLGPGVVVHTESLDFDPSENYYIYIRPKTAITGTKRIDKMTVTGSYVTRQVQTSGSIGVHELYGKLKYDFGKMSVFVKPRYLFVIDGAQDKLIDLGVNYNVVKGLDTSLMFCWGDFSAGRSGMYAKFIGRARNKGTDVTLRIDKVGSKYRHDIVNEYEFIYLNNFGRLILDGTFDLGVKIRQKLNSRFSLELKGDYVTDGSFHYGEKYPGTYLLWQAGVEYSFSKAVKAQAYYKAYDVPSGTAQFGDTVAKTSDIIGVKVSRAF
ncbi:MAG: S-layer homology domain-containing protein [Candidatus Margulisiibacteriota bacterium]|nr:S-layer homology domain-containing protein [Candidatus Margulisiibacteriota bacterium]